MKKRCNKLGTQAAELFLTCCRHGWAMEVKVHFLNCLQKIICGYISSWICFESITPSPDKYVYGATYGASVISYYLSSSCLKPPPQRAEAKVTVTDDGRAYKKFSISATEDTSRTSQVKNMNSVGFVFVLVFCCSTTYRTCVAQRKQEWR